MKKIRLISNILSLALNAYMPIIALVRKLGDYNVIINSAPVLALIPLFVTLGALALAIAEKERTGVPVLVISLVNVPIAALSFCAHLMYSDNTGAFIIGTATFVVAVAVATLSVKRLALRIILPAISVLFGALMFVIALILAIALAFGQRRVIAEAVSPDGEYRVEMIGGLIDASSDSLELIRTDEEIYLPFVHLFCDGREIWSGRFETGDSVYFKDNSTVVIKGEEIKVP
jgi:hypothetical protein